MHNMQHMPKNRGYLIGRKGSVYYEIVRQGRKAVYFAVVFNNDEEILEDGYYSIDEFDELLNCYRDYCMFD